MLTSTVDYSIRKIPEERALVRLMLVDDESDITEGLAACLSESGHLVTQAKSAEEALHLLAEGTPDILVTDLKMPGMGGLALLDRIREGYPGVSVIMMTAYGTIDSAIEAMKRGAHDFILKPFSAQQLEVRLSRLMEARRLRLENQKLREKLEALVSPSEMSSRNHAMRKVIEAIEGVAAKDDPVLIEGEGGSGKAMLARHLHAKSRRAEHPFVAVNCATLSQVLLEGELFGYVKGAFPGALTDQPGRLALADGGTLLLESAAELSPQLQARLARYLKEGVYERMGDPTPRRSRVRIIALCSTPISPEGACFLPELSAILSRTRFVSPPLRERTEDILPLAERYLKRALFSQGKTDRPLSNDVKAAFAAYRWPGNVRELYTVLERAAVVAAGPEITNNDLPERIRAPGGAVTPPTGAAGDSSLEEVERRHITQVLASTATLEEAATLLGINPSTLWRKRRRYGLE